MMISIPSTEAVEFVFMARIEVLRTPWTSSETVRKDTDQMEGISLVDEYARGDIAFEKIIE